MIDGYTVVLPSSTVPWISLDPFTAAGNTEFNCLLWMPPADQWAGDIVLVDSTHFTTLFGGTDSLRHFWRNLALMK